MATVTARGATWNTTLGAKSVASFTPTAGELLVAVVGIATSDTAPTMSDTDATITGWTMVDAFRSQAATGGLRIYCSNQGASGAAITVTMTPTADAGGGLAVLSVTSPAAFGASAVLGNGGQADVAAAVPAPVLDSSPSTNNPIIVAVMTNTNGTANCAPRSSPLYTEHYDLGFNTPPTGLEVQSVNSGETATTLTLGAAAPSTFASIAIEINTIAAANPIPSVAMAPPREL